MNAAPTKHLLSQEVTDKILRSMQEGLVVFNGDDQIQFLNESALRIFQFTAEKDIVGKHVRELFTSSQNAFDFLFLLEKEKHLHYHENTFIKSNGQKIICSLSASTIFDSTGGDILKAIILQDITERKQAEIQLEKYSAKLEKNNKELDEFAYIVSHDLKAPLRAIINLSQWLSEDLEAVLHDDNKKNLELLMGRVFRMEALINGILEYSKIGRSTIQSEVIDVGTLLAEILDLLLPPSHIEVVISSQMPVLKAPKIMLLQVFSNLISNAIKYNDKAQGLITIEAVEHEDHVQFSVADNGPGIPKEYHEKVFIIFQTLQSRDKVESTGIGLTIVRRIIEEQGGKIWIESAEAKGSKFIFRWPKQALSNTI